MYDSYVPEGKPFGGDFDRAGISPPLPTARCFLNVEPPQDAQSNRLTH